MKRLLLTAIALLSVGSVIAKRPTGHHQKCAEASKALHAVVGTHSKGPHGEKWGLTDKEYDSCVKSGKINVKVAKSKVAS